ncbi:hypothetical protein AMJ85_07045 [candidate division BRC1 bacterium SM23_51]|nr:MAG: hypothetical protein AMJ85_07045 [candidate division BRC1 bacterium SM23_51]
MDGIAKTPAICLRLVQPVEGLEPAHPLGGTTTTVGRHPSNDISIPVESVSRFHARIEQQGDQVLVVDLNSSNGTYVDGTRIEKGYLKPGHTVIFGNVEFRCESTEPEAEVVEDQFLKTPVRFVEAENKQSRLITEAEAGKRETAPLGAFIEVPTDRDTLAKAYRKLAALYRLSDILHAAPEEQQLLESFMDLIFEVVPADRGVILMRDDPDGGLEIRVSRSREPSDESGPIALSGTIIDRCMQERVAVLSQDATTDERFKAAQSVLLHDIRSTIVVPLVSESAILGVLHLDTRECVHAFTDDDLSFVTSLADDLALFLDHRRISAENQRNQEMAAVGAVITDLAHSIKNVLLLAEGGIQLMDRLIEEGDLERIGQSWQLTQKGLGRISTMVKEMLDYSRAVKVKKTKSNLNDVVRETCQSFQTEFENKGIALNLHLDPKLENAWLDVKGLERSLVNVLVNAREAINHDHGEITVATQMRPSRDLVLSIEDNGVGIPVAKLARIFFPLFSTKGGQGTGLGLSMIKKWVTAIGGTVNVHSTEGKGTRFVITLPREATGVGEDDTAS